MRLWLFCLMLCLPVQSLAQSCHVVVTVSNEFPPFNMKTRDGHWYGLAVDIAREVLFGAKCDADVVNIPWQRTMSMLRNGEVGMVPLTTITEQRAAYAHFVGPIYLEQTVFLGHQQLVKDLKLEDALRGFQGHIGKTQGTLYSESIEKLVSHPKVKRRIIPIRSDENKIAMFLQGRIQGMFEELAVAEYLYNQKVLVPEKFPIAMRFLPNPVYLAIGEKAVGSESLYRIRMSWRQMLEDGSIERIYQQYGVSLPDLTSLDYPQH